MSAAGAQEPDAVGGANHAAAWATLCLALIAVAAVLRDVFGVPWAAHAATPFLLAYFSLRWRHMRPSAKAILAIALALAAATAWRAGFAVFPAALDRAVYFLGLLTLLALLREAAAASDTVSRASAYIIAQPPGRRYAALTVGGHLFGALLNLGGYALLLDMVKRANMLEAAGGRADIVALRERRMTLAALRGFTSVPFWSPLSVTVALVLANVPGVAWLDLFVVGAPLSLAFMALGWLFDRIQSPPTRVGLLATPPAGGARAFLFVAAHVVALSTATLGVEETTGLAFQKSLLLVVPIYAFAWSVFLVRRQGLEAPAAAAALLARGASYNYPRYANEAAIFASSAFLGVILASLIPREALELAIRSANLATGLASPLLCLFGAALAVVGVNPMITISILAATLSTVALPGVSTREIAITLCGAWAISVGIGPFISTTVMTSGILGKPVTTICWRWNGLFGMTALLLFCLLLYLVEF